MQKLLDIHDLTVDFKTSEGVLRAVDEISFYLNKEETLAIVGESGSGKSVTSMAVMQLLNQQQTSIGGKLTYYSPSGERDMMLSGEKEMQKIRGKEIAMIFQEPMTSLNPVITCGEQVAEVLRHHMAMSRTEARQKTLQLFERVKLPHPERIYSSYPHQISGGQKQRVMIAMAISCNPRVLIADEPTTALDVTVQKTILELLQELQQEFKMGMIFITHDLGVVAHLAHRVGVMFKGRMVETGDVKSIFGAPAHPYTQALLACRPPVDKRYKRLPVVSDFLFTDDKGNMQSKTIHTSLLQPVPEEERKQRHEKLYQQKPLLEIREVSKIYTRSTGILGLKKEETQAVKQVSFNVYPGETLGIVGESGCGKTTLGKLILQLLPANNGQIIYRGQNLQQVSPRALQQIRKKIQVVFQDPFSSLNPRISIGEAIAEPMRVHKIYHGSAECRRQAIALLEKVGLSEKHYHRYPHEFSGGQRQRIVIARALGLKPEFIICDEPVSALDVSVQAQVLNLLADLKKDHELTYIFISHDLGVVRYFTDRIIVMRNGSIEQEGESDALYQFPQTAYTKELINAIPHIQVPQ